jgi:hypothetical protein
VEGGRWRGVVVAALRGRVAASASAGGRDGGGREVEHPAAVAPSCLGSGNLVRSGKGNAGFDRGGGAWGRSGPIWA